MMCGETKKRPSDHNSHRGAHAPATCFVRKCKKAPPQLMVSQLWVGLGMLLPLFTQDTLLVLVVISQEYTMTGLTGKKLPHDKFAHFQFDLEERE